MPRGLSMGKLQVFSPGTGGDSLRLQPGKFPKGKLRGGSFMACNNKPNGAFWTSSYKSKFKGSDWTDWKKKEMKRWHSGIGAVFEVQSGAKILKIRNHKDYMKIQKKFPMRVECPSGELYLNWKKVSKVYDGVQLAGSTMSIPMLGQWDVESTAWFNMKKLEFIGTTKV